MPPPMMSGGQFTEKDLANAQLPAAPESDNNLEVLLRPGLLADVEIIVERIPNAIHVPAQACVSKRTASRSRSGEERQSVRDERPIKPLKRSESTMIIAAGLNAGRDRALSDPFAKPGDKKEGKSGMAARRRWPCRRRRWRRAPGRQISDVDPFQSTFPNCTWGSPASWCTSCAACSPCWA